MTSASVDQRQVGMVAPAEAGIVCQNVTKIYTGAPSGPPGGWAMGGPPPGGSMGGGRQGRPPTGGPANGVAPRPAGPVKAVDSLTLAVRRGEFFGLLGPNGAGKSTTIGMLTSRVIPTAGRVYVDGIDVVAHPALARTRLAVVTQVPALDRSLSVFDNLYFHGRYFNISRGESRRRATALIERFQLQDKARVNVETLSGGLAQRVQIARALLHEPAVLFLDEPTAGLDPQARLALWGSLRELNQAGQTILLTTHYMEEADQLCERIAIIDHGQLLALDTPDGLKAQVHAERILTLTLNRAAEATLQQRLSQISGVVNVKADGRLVRVYAGQAMGLVARVVEAIGDGGAELRDLASSEPTLESVYLKLTGREYRG